MWRRRVSRLLDLRAVSGSISGTPARAKGCKAIIVKGKEEVKTQKKTEVRSQERLGNA
jgi:hypothetical protein